MILSIIRKKKTVPGVDYNKELKSDDLPATQGYINAVRLELKADITTLNLEVKAEFSRMEEKFFRLEAKMSEMLASMAQMHANNEKQRNENRIVLDSMSVLIERQDKVERRIDDLTGLPS